MENSNNDINPKQNYIFIIPLDSNESSNNSKNNEDSQPEKINEKIEKQITNEKKLSNENEEKANLLDVNDINKVNKKSVDENYAINEDIDNNTDNCN